MTTKNLPFTLCLFLMAAVFIFLPKKSITDELGMKSMDSRLNTLVRIIDQTNQGNYFQYDTGIPMETIWEDPGMGVSLSLIGYARKFLNAPYNKVFPEDIYYIQLFLIVLFILLPYSGLFRYLPRWYAVIPPVFLLICVLGKFLRFHWDQRWVTCLATFWVITAQVNLFTFHKNAKENKPDHSKAGRMWLNFMGVGFGLGFLSLFRRNVFMEGMVILLLSLAIFLILRLWHTPPKKASVIKIFSGLAVFLVLGAYIPDVSVHALWRIRDLRREIKIIDRNPGHPLWHVLYLSLGYVKNEKNIRWSDGRGFEHARRIEPNIQYATNDYEKLMRSLYIKEVVRRPSLLAKNVIAKFNEIVSYYRHIPLILSFVLLVLILAVPKYRLIAFMSASGICIWSLTPLLTHPAKEYCLSLYMGMVTWAVILGTLILIDPMSKLDIHALFKKKKSLGLIATAALITGLPSAVYVAFQNKIVDYPGKYMAVLETTNDRIIYEDVVMEDRETSFRFEIPAGRKDVSNLRINPWHHNWNKIRITNLRFYDGKNREVYSAAPLNSSEWSFYNTRVETVGGIPTSVPRVPTYGLIWTPKNDFSARSFEITLEALR